jgi:cystathionine beta-synthase
VDNIVRVSDRDSFLWTRRLVSEEGIFAGGSSGAAIAGAVHYAADLPKDRLVIVILPDSGSRYLSKIFDDKWMRENGYLDSEWGEVTLREVLQAKPSNELVFAGDEEDVHAVSEKMKHHDISQLPVLDKNKNLVGMVREVDLLTHLLAGKNGDDKANLISGIMQSAPPSFASSTLMADAIQYIVKHNVVVVTEGSEISGVLTKIDALDFIQG